MPTVFRVSGWWRESEAASAASALLSQDDMKDEFINDWHINVEAETADGNVKIISDDDLTEEQVALLRNYFENHPEQVMPQWEQDELTQTTALVAQVEKVTASVSATLDTEDVRDAIRALAELQGVKL